MNLRILVGLLFIVFLGLFGCKNEDTEAPVISVSNPTEGLVIENGMLNLEAKISDNEFLKETKIQLLNTDTGDFDFEKTDNQTGTEVTISESLSLDVPDGGNFELTISATDDSGNTSSETIAFEAAATNRGTLALNFRLEYDGEPLVMFQEYDYPDPVFPFSLSLFSFFLAEVTVIGADGDREILEIERLRINEEQDDLPSALEGVTASIPLLEPGSFSGIRFGIGVPSDLNAMSPVDFPQGHPLFFSGEYWDSWDSYIFSKIEGKADTNNDGVKETPMALHVGADNTYRIKEYDTDFSVDAQQTTSLSFVIDIKDVFEKNGSVYDLISTPQIHSLDQIGSAVELADNMKAAFR